MSNKILLNADGKVLTSNDKILKAPEGVNVMKPLLDGRKEAYYLFRNFNGENIDNIISYSDTENVETTEYMFYKCTNLQTIPQLDMSMVINMNNMFRDCTNLKTIPLLNTSKVIDMSYAFYNCTNLQSIPQLDMSSATTTYSMFQNCTNLKTIPQLETGNVTVMDWMFSKCTNLQTISQLDTSKATDMNYVFNDCTNLQTIDITSLDKISSTDNINCLCRFCYSLTKFIIRNMTVIPPLNSNSFNYCYHFLGTVNSTYNPEGLKDGRIYIPDDYVEQLKQATNWSKYADIIAPLSTLQEE